MFSQLFNVKKKKSTNSKYIPINNSDNSVRHYAKLLSGFRFILNIFNFVLKITPEEYYYPHSTDEATDGQLGAITFLRLLTHTQLCDQA